MFNLNLGENKMIHRLSDQLELYAQQGQGAQSYYQEIHMQQ